MPPSSWSTMSDLFSLNIFALKSEIFSFPSQSPFSVKSNSLDNVQDALDMPFLTPLSSPKAPCTFDNYSPSGPRSSSYAKVSPSLFIPSVSSSILLPSTRSSLNLLPIPSSQRSIVHHDQHEDPSLMDSSLSFVHMMSKTVDGGSPTSFLTCSSGWDPGVICEAVALPSLLNSPPSWETLQRMAAIQVSSQRTDVLVATGGVGLGLENFSLLQSRPSFGSNSRIAIATKVYLSPSLVDVSAVCTNNSTDDTNSLIKINDQKDMNVRDHDKLSSLPFDPDSGIPNCRPHLDHSPAQTVGSVSSNPPSDVSSVTGSFYEDPFHWDLVLPALPCSQDTTTSTSDVPSSRSSPVLPRSSSQSLQRHQVQDEYSSSSSEPGLTSASSSGSEVIPTIVVMNPDSMSIPVQASISSIVGLYEGFPPQAESLLAMKQATPLPTIKEILGETDIGNDGWWSGDDTEGDDSYDEADFEIVAVSALRTRLETIFEEDEAEKECEYDNECTAFVSSDRGCITNTTSFPSGDGKNTSLVTTSVTSSSWTSSFSDAHISKIGSSIITGSDSFYSQVSRRRNFPTSYSMTSTVKLVYCESDSSLAESQFSTGSPPHAAGNSTRREDDERPWFFHMEDGAILEIPMVVQSSSSSTTGSKFADKLANFPNVPTSPFLSPFPSPFPSSALTARRYGLDITEPASDISGRSVTGLGLSLDHSAVISPHLSPTWVSGRSLDTASSSMLGLGISNIAARHPSSPLASSVSFEFQDHDIDLGFIANLNTSVHSERVTGILSSPNRVETAGRKERHVRFLSEDFKPKIADVGTRRHSKRRTVFFARVKKSCFKRRNIYIPPLDSEVAAHYDRSDNGGLPSSFSSSSIFERRKWQCRRGSVLNIGGRFLGGLKRLKGCWALVEKDGHDDEFWDMQQGAIGGGGHTGMVGNWQSDENDARRVERERHLFYERWKNVWS